MEKLQSVKVRAMDKRETLENLDLKGKIHNVQNDLFLGWKNITEKAKKEAKTLNKRARKALATYEEGSSVRYDQIYDCDFDTGFNIWKKFQKHWINIRDETTENAKKAELVDIEVAEVIKDWRKWDSVVQALHNHLISLPDIIGQVEIAQNQICTIGNQILKIDQLLLDFDDLCEKVELERQKFKQKSELSQLVERRQLQFQAEKEKHEMTDEECQQMARVVERQESIEKQQIYEDAFLEQMDRYIKYGELEKPIAGSVEHEKSVDEVSFDESDLNALKEFLGPEELNSVLKSQATCSNAEHKMDPSKETTIKETPSKDHNSDTSLNNEDKSEVESEIPDVNTDEQEHNAALSISEDSKAQAKTENCIKEDNDNIE